MQLQTAKRSIGADLPSITELHQLRPGSFCKVQTSNGEYFWCSLTSGYRPNKTYAAQVETVALTVPGMRRGDVVILEKHNVFEII